MYKNNIQNYGTALNDRYSVGKKYETKACLFFDEVWFILHTNELQKVRGRKGSAVKKNTLVYRNIQIRMEPFTYSINSIRYMIDIST
jgi:hypothetical protein